MARIKGISREIDVLVKKHLSTEAQQRLIADVAKTEIKQADDNNARVMGRRLPYDVFVDGVRDAPLTRVNPNRGIILAQWEMIFEVIEYVAKLLEENSPVGSGPYSDGHTPGRYQRSHTLFADKEIVHKPDPARVAREWVFMSSVPYARKIERGQSSPAAVYETAAQMATARYGNLCSIRFTMLDWLGGKSMLTDWLNGKDYSALGIAAGLRQSVKNSRQPAIIISPK